MNPFKYIGNQVKWAVTSHPGKLIVGSILLLDLSNAGINHYKMNVQDEVITSLQPQCSVELQLRSDIEAQNAPMVKMRDGVETHLQDLFVILPDYKTTIDGQEPQPWEPDDILYPSSEHGDYHRAGNRFVEELDSLINWNLDRFESLDDTTKACVTAIDQAEKKRADYKGDRNFNLFLSGLLGAMLAGFTYGDHLKRNEER